MEVFMQILATRFPPLVADMLALLLAWWLLPLLSSRFQLQQDVQGFGNTVIIGGFFLLFCLAVYGIKKLKPEQARTWEDTLTFLSHKHVMAVLAVFFALVLSIATAYVAGFLDSVIAINRGLLDEPSVTIYLLLTPASWFGLALVYMLILTAPPGEPMPRKEGTIEPRTVRYLLISVFGLVGVSLMAIVLTAVWQAVWARFVAPPEPTIAIMLNLALYLLLFLPPRLIYLGKLPREAAPTVFALVTYLPLLTYLAAVAMPGE
jgi:hypothetical protein